VFRSFVGDVRRLEPIKFVPGVIAEKLEIRIFREYLPQMGVAAEGVISSDVIA